MKQSLIEQLRDEVNGKPPPEGWYSISQLVELLNAKRSVLEGFVVQKKWECRKFRTITSDGKLMNVKHYNVGKL